MASATCFLVFTLPAAAEVTIAKGDTWDAYVAGRASAFFSYATGDAYPVPKVAGSKIEPGGGLDASDPPRDAILDYDDMGMPIPNKQGRISKMRMRSGYYPNILTVGVHKRFGDRLKLTGQMSVWGTIESDDIKSASIYDPANGGRDNGVSADFREGFLRLESDWGQLDGGRFMGLVGRGLTEMDSLYLHGYGAGFPTVRRNGLDPVTGDLTAAGPMGGMTGFGVLSSSYAAGLAYTTPSLAGIKLALGVFDPVIYPSSGWNTSRSVRPEAELAYDLRQGTTALHVFGSAGFQSVNLANTKYSATFWAATFGARAEFGPVHLGAGGFVGKGAGINHAFDVNPAIASSSTMRTVTTLNPDGTPNVSMEKTNELRSQRGFVGMAQVVLGAVDINAGVGQTQNLLLPADKAAAMLLSALKTQTGISAGVVYHVDESFHLDVDFMNGTYRWYNGESQKVNVFNAGVTATF
ncbi:MAG TPA: hypothetical protein VHB79_34600 [Polyangiaceae bacterium]|nr:hypothetical protein [Polyangiaceae bacterium]